MMYNKLIESCFFNPKHVGILDLNQSYAVHYRVGEPGRGDILDLFLLSDKQGLIIKACFKAYGNPYLIAAAEWLCRELEGSLLQEHPRVTHIQLAELFAIPKTRYAVALQLEDGYQQLVLMMKDKLEGECHE